MFHKKSSALARPLPRQSALEKRRLERIGMFKKGELVSTDKIFDGMSLCDKYGHKIWEEKMNGNKLYIVLDDEMMSSRVVYDSSGKFYRIFLEYLKGYAHE